MKKIISLLIVLATVLALSACNSEEIKDNHSTTQTTVNSSSTVETAEATDNETTMVGDTVDPGEYRLGGSIETDILRITLTNAEFAIKLNGESSGTYDEIKSGKTKLSEDYFRAEEYNPETDSGLAYIAPKGHTFVAIEYVAQNLDRTSISFDGTFNKDLFAVEYDGNTYPCTTNYGCESDQGYNWIKYTSVNVFLANNTPKHLRCYVDIPIDVTDLNDDFTLILTLPNSKGEFTKFKYSVKAEDRIEQAEKEMPLDEAIYSFLENEGQEYFTNHMNDYALLSGDEITSALSGMRYSIEIKKPTGSWEGMFKFEADSRIQETHPLIGTGYFNNRTWTVNGNTLILDGKDVCEVRLITDGKYLFVKDGKPYAIIK